MFGSKIYCTHLGKKVSKKIAVSCDYFTAEMKKDEKGSAWAERLLTVDYEPTCDDCSFNKKFKGVFKKPLRK